MITETMSRGDALSHFLESVLRSSLSFKVGIVFIVGAGIFIFLWMMMHILNKRYPHFNLGLSLNLPALVGIFLSGCQLAFCIPGFMMGSDDFQIETPQLYFDIFASGIPIFLGGLVSLALYICYAALLVFLKYIIKSPHRDSYSVSRQDR